MKWCCWAVQAKFSANEAHLLQTMTACHYSIMFLVYIDYTIAAKAACLTELLKSTWDKHVLCNCHFSLTSLVCSLQGLCSYDQYRCGKPLCLMSPGLDMATYLKIGYFSRQMLHRRYIPKGKKAAWHFELIKHVFFSLVTCCLLRCLTSCFQSFCKNMCHHTLGIIITTYIRASQTDQYSLIWPVSHFPQTNNIVWWW